MPCTSSENGTIVNKYKGRENQLMAPLLMHLFELIRQKKYPVNYVSLYLVDFNNTPFAILSYEMNVIWRCFVVRFFSLNLHVMMKRKGKITHVHDRARHHVHPPVKLEDWQSGGEMP